MALKTNLKKWVLDRVCKILKLKIFQEVCSQLPKEIIRYMLEI